VASRLGGEALECRARERFIGRSTEINLCCASVRNIRSVLAVEPQRYREVLPIKSHREILRNGADVIDWADAGATSEGRKD